MSQDQIQCHFISNTHWDREWRFSAQRTRYMLAYLLDMLLDILEKEPEFKHFHLDSQTLPIQDYLEVYPEKAAALKKHIAAGQLAVGPWFCLPDEFCVSGESLIRNLLLGHKMAKEFGGVSKTGYSPFGWGQISQMPQIYQGFGIDMISFYRGINTYVSPRSEYIWEGPDGTRIVGSRLAARPRYNVWYIIQRPVYWNQEDENDRLIPWKRGNGPFRFVNRDKSELDYQYAHPEFNYHAENVPARARQAIEEQDPDWSTPHRFWSAGHDSSVPDIREVRMIADCAKALEGQAAVFHSTITDFQDGVKAHISDDWPVVRGEMRHLFTVGSSSELMPGIISSRTYIKQDNFVTERDLTSYAEPLAVFASLLGAPYPDNFLALAYNYLLQNHGHDSIGACGRDILYKDMIFRTRQSREICQCVMERAMMDVVGAVDLSSWDAADVALVVFNPAPFGRSEVMPAIIEVPAEWESRDIEIVDDAGNPVALQMEAQAPVAQIVQSPNDTANVMLGTRYYVSAEFQDIPGMGYRTYAVKPVTGSKFSSPKTMCTGPQTMENEYLVVHINANGTLDLYDKRTERQYRGLGYLRDSGETGDPWTHTPPPRDTLLTTLNETAAVALIQDGELETTFRVSLNWSLPAGRTADDQARSDRYKPYPIVNTVTVRKGQPWVEVVTQVDNTVEDHYLRVSFPTGINTDEVQAQGQFDVLTRPVQVPDASLFDEPPIFEYPMNSFIDMSDGQVGLALLNEGLKAYETHTDAEHTVSLVLIRGYPLRICVTQEMQDYSHLDKGTQCLGEQTFKYAIMPHAGDWAGGKIWQASEQFNLHLQAAQVGPTAHGNQPLTRSFLEFQEEGLHVSAVKHGESGTGWIVRVFNPLATSVQNAIRLNGGWTGPSEIQSPVERLQAEFALPTGQGSRWSTVRLVTLEELAERDLEMDDDGWVTFEIAPKKILTFEFVP